jgi:hypothetical protein
MVRVTHVHMVGGSDHEHIASVKWINQSNQTGESTRAQMVAFIEGGDKAYVSDGQNSVWIGVVNATPKYIRTHADTDGPLGRDRISLELSDALLL